MGLVSVTQRAGGRVSGRADREQKQEKLLASTAIDRQSRLVVQKLDLKPRMRKVDMGKSVAVAAGRAQGFLLTFSTEKQSAQTTWKLEYRADHGTTRLDRLVNAAVSRTLYSKQETQR